jgi:NAD+ diphosphatase
MAEYTFCPKCASKIEPEIIDSLERQSCSSPDCNFIFFDNPVPVVAALVHHEEKILLARNSAWPEGLFSMITGFLEKNESPEEAVLRELREELGLEGKIKSFLGHHSLHRFNQLIIAYLIEAEGQLNLGEEISEFKYLTVEEVFNYDFGPLVITDNVVKEMYRQYQLQR